MKNLLRDIVDDATGVFLPLIGIVVLIVTWPVLMLSVLVVWALNLANMAVWSLRDRAKQWVAR